MNIDTNEAEIIIVNDNDMYNLVNALDHCSSSIDELATLMESMLPALINAVSYSNVNTTKIEWHDIAADFYEPSYIGGK